MSEGSIEESPIVEVNPARIRAIKRSAVVELSMQGRAPLEISQALDMPTNTVNSIRRRWKRCFPDINDVDSFRQVKADIFSAAQLAQLKSAMTPSKIKKLSSLGNIVAAEKLYKMERLENDKSTANVAIKFNDVGIEKS